MCGIFGELSPQLSASVEQSFASKANALLRHRGPDGQGQWRDASCLLGHRRLSILDLSDSSAQPMVSASGRLVLSFNGEVYNYRELRSQLSAPVGGWRTESDTEVLLELLDQRGISSLGLVVGMFGFALWDRASKRLTLARDRIGKKPLLYARTTEGALRFASELAPLFVDNVVERVTNGQLIREFLQYGYVSAPRTAFSTVSSLEPGHTLTASVHADGLVIETQRYWRLPDWNPLPVTLHDQWREEFRSTLEDSVRIRLRSDVPIGSFLSGGVDSSVVSLIASQQHPEPLKTYTFALGDAANSEAPWAQEVSDHIGAVQTTIQAKLPNPADLTRLIEIYGELNGDMSAIAALGVSQAARHHVTVALTGNGGDELLAGYQRYYYAEKMVNASKKYPASVKSLVAHFSRRLPEWLRGDNRLALFSDDFASVYQAVCKTFAVRDVPLVLRLRPQGAVADPIISVMKPLEGLPYFVQTMAADVATYLPGDTLFTLDRASMRFGLELRSPLLDHRLFELVLRGRPEWVLDGDKGKRPLRELYAGQLPSSVFNRPKLGFTVPAVAWMNAGLFRDQEQALFSGRGLISTVIDHRAAKRIFSGFRHHLHSYAGRLWHLLVLQEWLEYWRPRVE